MWSFDSSDDVREKLLSIIRIGEVSSVNPAAGTCRVAFDDDSGIVSYDLPVIQRNTYKNHYFNMPDVGEDVLCVFLASGTEEGFVLGSFYAEEIAPPESSIDKSTIVFSDGTKLSYDRAAHKLTADVKGDIEATVTGKVNATAQGQVTVKSSTSITLHAPVINLNGAICTRSESGGRGTMTINGNINQTGGQTVSEDVVASGVSLLRHTHGGVQEGGDSTGSPD